MMMPLDICPGYCVRYGTLKSQRRSIVNTQIKNNLDKLLPDSYNHDKMVWDALRDNTPIDRIAIAVGPGNKRINHVREALSCFLRDDVAFHPAGWTPRWWESLLGAVSSVIAGMQLPGDWFPAIEPPRFVHGQGQGICDIFGARVEPQEDENELYFAHPLPADPAEIDAIQPEPLEKSIYTALD